MKIKKIAVVLNGFIHDFAAGYWLATVMTIVFLNDLQAKYLNLDELLQQIARFFFWNGIVCVIIVLATGGARGFTYVNNFYGADSERLRRRLLIVKHIVLFAVFGFGTRIAWGMAFK